MGWLGWTILILFVLAAIGGASGSKKSRNRRKRSDPKKQAVEETRDIRAEAQAIADKISTLKQLEALEQKMLDADERYANAATDRAQQSALHRRDVLGRAHDIASQKTYLWQFIPSCDIHTPKAVLDKAYKVFSKTQWEKIQGTLCDDPDDWIELDGGAEPEEPDESIALLKRFRTIVESAERQESKVKKINSLVYGEDFFDDFFELADDMTAGDEWFAMQLSNDGLPLAHKLYSEGYTTPEKCLSIDVVEFAKRDRITSDQVEALKKYQSKVRKRLDAETVAQHKS